MDIALIRLHHDFFLVLLGHVFDFNSRCADHSEAEFLVEYLSDLVSSYELDIVLSNLADLSTLAFDHTVAIFITAQFDEAGQFWIFTQ